ncbi:SLATT domain-containing protein [Thalassomonas viridans]|uniref:SLATT domain-containing protein n=1 Tax=Thalassomonas viridans TaxID=137584 RepID=A0AAF0C8I4_9GAMM|nr:SLATT domain-containing protein [Thalassomonas viridans]WDE04783.1 SLATT domain-containing protein [Thalassomonas viridans]
MSLPDSIWWTRKARIQTEKRLLANAFQAQVILLWYSLFAVFVSVYYLKFNATSEYSGVAWVVFSVMVLIISSFTSALSFKERAALIKECYETLSGIYQRAIKTPADKNIETEYGQVLSVCENHTDKDFHKAICLEYLSHSTPNGVSGGLTKIPTRYIWFMFLIHCFYRIMFLFFMYSLPIIIFVTLEKL